MAVTLALGACGGGGSTTGEGRAIEGTAYGGDYSLAQACEAGDATGTNPTGMGAATWTGIAEAAATGTFELLQGIATVTTADLLRPEGDVAIDVPGHHIGAPGRADMPLENGRFGAGTAGDARARLEAPERKNRESHQAVGFLSTTVVHAVRTMPPEQLRHRTARSA